MSGALRRKKKRSKWGADLEANPMEYGVGLVGEATDAAHFPAMRDVAGPDPVSGNWRTANLHGDTPQGGLQRQVRIRRTGLKLIGAFWLDFNRQEGRIRLIISQANPLAPPASGVKKW